MKARKQKRKVHIDGKAYVYIEDSGTDTIRVYNPENRQIWFELASHETPADVKQAIIAKLNPDRFLPRVHQCGKCPWKQSTNPHEIPHGYCTVKHRGLSSTIAQEGVFNLGQTLEMMACHHSEPGAPEPCVGWLHNQLGVGNNIGLRLLAMKWENVGDLTIYGRQHPTFEDTLPNSQDND